MANSSAYDLLNQGLAIVKKQALPVAQKSLLAGLVFVHMVADVVETLSRHGTEEERQQLKTDILRVVHEQVTPLDIPGLPNWLEPFVDNAVETGLAAGSDVVLARLAAIRAEIDAVLAQK